MRRPDLSRNSSNIYVIDLLMMILSCTLEPEILYLAYLELEVTSSAIVGLKAFLASPNLP